MIFDGLAFLKEFNIPYVTQSANVSQGWVGLRCPDCGDKSDHLGLNLAVGAFSCWRCGSKGTIETIQHLLGIPRQDASRIYAQFLVRKVGKNEGSYRPKASASQVILPEKTFTKTEQKYLARRHLSNAVGLYDLRSGGISGDWAWRIVIPIILNGVIVSATGRYIVKPPEGVPKYKTLSHGQEIVHHKHILLGLDFVEDKIIVVEGPIDAIRGGPGFASSFGINMMPEQIALLSKYKEVIFLFDNEDQAQRQAEKYATMVATLGSGNVEVARLEGIKDLGDATDDEIADVRKEFGL
jgi:hypothetical protein